MFKFLKIIMEVLHCPDNIKVHFAGCEVQNQFEAIKTLGVNYGLYTCYPFVERMIFKKPKSPIMALKFMNKDNLAKEIPHYIIKSNKHTIQDSGLFTLMFGAAKGNCDEKLVNLWYDKLVEFTLENSLDVTCVEVDCQKLLGVEKAWEFRKRIKEDLKGHRIINVFHLEDGRKGLDRLIEFSEYIAISVPELRFAKKSNHVVWLANYIKNKKPSIDIHLLGCTQMNILRECKFCTSADSTSYISGKRFGFLGTKHINSLITENVKNMVGLDNWNHIYNIPNSETNTNFLCATTIKHKKLYSELGNQDYKPYKYH